MAFSPLGSGPRTPANRGQRRQNTKQQRRAAAKLVFEALEPRVLLSADPLSVALGGDAAHPLAHDVIIQEVTQPATSRDHTTVQMIQVVEQGPKPQVLASVAAANVSSIHITSGTGDTKLTVDTASFGKTALPSITFAGGNGNNTLTVTGPHETDWDITGANSGAVKGSASIAFTGVSNLTGGTNANIFTVEQVGSLRGTLDGGPGVDGTLIFNNYKVTNAIYTASGPHSGTVALDGSVFTYADLAPIIFNGTAANVTITGTGQLGLADTGVAGQVELQSFNNSLENVTFTDPTASLTVNMVGGTDSLAISTLHLAGASLSANGTGADAITVNAGAYVSTRATANDTLAAPSTANSGNLSFEAQSITLSTGSFLYTNANSGFAAGNISLDAMSTGGAGQPAVASVAVHGAQVVGGSITIDSTANANATISQQILATLSLNATATTSVDGASFIASTVGGVSIDSNVNVTGKVTASAAALGSLNADAAIALANVNANATTTIGGTALLGAIGTFTVHSTNNTTVTTTADGAAGGATAVGGSVALSNVTTNSRALLGTGV
ncbi:MAG: hypothetical protein QOF70_2811, partial [Acetobacteraceae bacterium]|nr:hypothetical protein [Acetobacteraceae bacterium]